MTPFLKIWDLLSASQRRSALVLFNLMLVGMILETLGIGLVIPALALMTQENPAARYPAIGRVLAWMGNPGQQQVVVAGMILLVAVYVIKTVFLGFLAWWQARFVYGFQAGLSQQLFENYLRQPYTFHLQRNSAELIRNTIGQVAEITYVLQVGLMLLTETLVLAGVCGLLISVEPFGATLVASVLLLAGWSFHRATRSRLLRWGEAHQHHEGLRIQHLQQGLGGVKELKLLGREKEFLDQYARHCQGSAEVSRHQVTLQALPRLWLELLAVAGLAALVFIMIWQGRGVENLLPTLGLFAAAAFRFMPSINRVLSSIQGIRYHLPVIHTLHSELRSLRIEPALTGGNRRDINRDIQLDRVSYRYPDAERPALTAVSLTIRCGTTVGFIGGSGAGKSTLVDVILGLLSPMEGVVRVDGTDIQENLRGWQDQIGYVPQTIYLTDDTLRGNIAFGVPAGQIDDIAVDRAIAAAQLKMFVADLPLGLDTMVGERGVRLSGGQRQRIGIARALYHDPAVLVLDEATSALDVATERDVMEAVRALHGEKTILIVAHRLSTVEHCDSLYRLEHGRIAESGEAALVLRK